MFRGSLMLELVSQVLRLSFNGECGARCISEQQFSTLIETQLIKNSNVVVFYGNQLEPRYTEVLSALFTKHLNVNVNLCISTTSSFQTQLRECPSIAATVEAALSRRTRGRKHCQELLKYDNNLLNIT